MDFCFKLKTLSIGFLLALQILAHSQEFVHSLPLNSDTGYITLSWSEDRPGPYALEMSQDSNFQSSQLIYDGYDHATFLSGLADGSYFFRVRSKASSIEPQAWSKPTKLDVRHHTLRSAFLLFSIGLVSFVLVIIAILKGHGKSKFGAPQT